MDIQKVEIPLKRFLLIESCPKAWNTMDLYVFREDEVTFYVGQSHLAFSRVWDHLLAGFHSHSIIGRFVWCNWPRSMRFTIELLSSRSEEFTSVGNNLDAAERLLIQQLSPCFNITLNLVPTPLPASYQPANGRLRCSRSLNKLIHEAQRVARADDTRALVANLS
jgi:hypothetical protein